MGLFDKLFEKNSVKEEYLEDKLDWYLSHETENMYYSMSYLQRIDFIFDYLLMLCFKNENKSYKYNSIDNFYKWKESSKRSTNNHLDLYLKLSYLFVLFIIDSENFRFSGYKNALSIDTNPMLHFYELLNYNSINYRYNTAKALIELLHNRKYSTYNDFFKALSTYDNKELYLIERAIISLFPHVNITKSYGIEINSLTERDKYLDFIREEVLEFIVTQKKVSAPALCREFKMSLNRAINLINELETMGMIEPVKQL